MTNHNRGRWVNSIVASAAASAAGLLLALSSVAASATVAPGVFAPARIVTSPHGKPPAPVICTAQEDLEGVYGVGTPPTPVPQGCLLDFTFNDSTLTGTQASDYVPVSSLRITPSTTDVMVDKTMTITLNLGYPLCSQAQLSNGPSSTPCSYDPEILSARWIPYNEPGYQYPTTATFNACGQNSQGQLPVGVDSITCTGSFSEPAGAHYRIDPNAWLIIRAKAQVDSSNASINGEEFTEDAVSMVASAAATLPGPVTIPFSAGSSALSATATSQLSALAAKLSSGAAVRVTGYAKGDATLARKRAAAAAAYLKAKVSVATAQRIVTTQSTNKVTVVTIKR